MNMRIKSFLFSVIMLFSILASHAQEDTLQEVAKQDAQAASTYPFESLRMYSPNTYAFGRYGDVPVDYSTGKTNVTIPLTAIQSGSLSVNVSLNYYGGGIKVDQDATTVGLGWSLFAGGVITRQVRGIPDGFNNKGEFMSRPTIRMEQKDGESNADFIKEVLPSIEYVADVYASPSTSMEDPAPDLFYYNFCGHTGSFYLDKKGHGKIVKYDGLQIDMLYEKNGNGGTEYFKLFDEQGNEYLFTELEVSINGRDEIITAWYLSSITSQTDDKISFSYISGGTLSQYSLERQNTKIYMEINPNATNHEIPKVYQQQRFQQGALVRGVVLSKITSSNGGYVDFLYDTGHRKDGYNGTGDILTNVIAYNSLGQKVKGYHLSYDYFVADDGHKNPNAKEYDYLNYRLKLCSVQEISSDGKDTQPPYRFSYLGDAGNSTYLLPYRMSPSQDGWGYYNGTGNQCLLPNNKGEEFRTDSWYGYMNPDHEVPYMQSYVVTGGGDRGFNSQAVMACMLNKISYPLGGNTVFEYGTHEINSSYGGLVGGGLRIERITNDDVNGNLTIRTFTYDYPHEPTTCGLYENSYYTVFWQRVDENGYGGNRELLEGFGVWPWLIDKPYIVQIDSYPLSAFGVESEFSYPKVEENINGQKRIVYEYSTCANIYSPMDGVEVPYDGASLFIYDSTNGLVGDMIVRDNINPCIFPYMHYPNNDWGRGDLLRKRIYDENGYLCSDDQYTYNARTLEEEVGYKAVKFADFIYIVAADYVFSGCSNLSKETHFLDGVTTEMTYVYKNMRQTKPSEVQIVLSDGYKKVDKYYYPSDYGNLLASLVSKNIVSPLDIRSYVGGKLVSGIQAQLNDYGQVATLYKYDGNGQDVSFSKSNPYTFSPYINKEYETTSHVLLSEYFKKENKKYCYVWSYNNAYPIAKVEMCGKDTDESLYRQLQQVMGQKLNPTNSDYETMRQKLDAVSNVNYTLYKYIPSVGISETIDSRNVRYKYEYDSFGRLAKKKLLLGNKEYSLEDYSIHFKQ